MPKLKPGTKPMRRITICIDAKDWARVRLIAYDNGRTPSSVARSAIQEYTATHYEPASQRALSLFEKRMGE